MTGFPSESSNSQKIPWKPWEIIAALLILSLALLTRLPRLDQYVTPDEPYWLVNSANFYYALGQREFADTFQLEHPGVTTMWAGTLGFLQQFPGYRGTGVGQIDIDNHEAVFEQFGQQALDLLAAGRMFIVLGVCALLLISYLYARQLLGVPAALLGMALIALDPMHIALSRWLHTDAIQSTPMLLSALALLVYLLRGRRVVHLLISGAAAGLAVLTKSPALFLLPYTGLMLLIDLWHQYRSQQPLSTPALLWRTVWPLLLWSLSAVVIFIALWPAMWVAPADSLNRMVNMAMVSARYGHSTSLFFEGQVIADGSLGIQHWYFYPLTFLWRTTPLILMGLALAGVGMWSQRDPFKNNATRRTFTALLLFAVFYTVMISLSAKRFDRYLLPIYGPIDLLAGAGWAFLAASLRRGAVTTLRQMALALLFTGVVFVQMLYVLPTFPYYISYYNPLMGGSARAPEVMMIGFGEGLDAAARYLNQKPAAETLTTSVWYDTGPYSYYSVGESLYINLTNDISNKRLKTLFSADYMVIYIHQWQRQIPKPLLKIIAGETPEKVITINGLDYAEIYDLRNGALLDQIP